MTEKAIHTEENTILIVEDDETSSILLQVYLSKEKYNLLYAVNGKMAVQMFRENPDIDLILMDLKMPVMDGYEATRQIKEMNRNIPIIAQSAYALSGDNVKALEAGCDDYVTKPVKKEELLAKIEALL
ncbi:MAG: response regulator [Mariniphaga sp.]|jgi:CheY-like chemotaxis protein|nr:response regulator [Mariniphaga sp.]